MSNRKTLALYSKLFLWLFIASTSIIKAQSVEQVTAQFVSKNNNENLIGLVATLINVSDTNQKHKVSSNENGIVTFTKLPAGNYILRTNYIGFKSFISSVKIDSSTKYLGVFKLEEGTTQLKDILIQEQALRTQIKGDTIEINANAYKTNTDASVQDLVTKMPGITNDNGTIKAQGENVQKVTIDGREFFGDDVNLALKNLPAEIVDKIQVFDRQSDQSLFTGFNDGNTQKALNIVTKAGKSNGSFGKVYGGYGTNDRYSAGGNINFFRGKQRITVVGLSNNINQQNFSSQDLVGVSNNSTAPGRGGMGGGMRGGPGGMRGGPGGGDNPSNNFITSNQGGINTTNSLGVNFSDSWGKKINFTGSYFFNKSVNNTDNSIERINFFSDGKNQFYKQTSSTNTDNLNHRLNFRIEYNIDSNNTLLITPKLSFQNNTSSTYSLGNTTLSNSTLNSTDNVNNSTNNAVSFNNNILYRHKFSKPGRTISISVGTDINDKNVQTDLVTKTIYYSTTDSVVNNNQRSTTLNNSYTLNGSINYTENIGKNGMLMLNYSPSYTNTNNNKQTNLLDTATQTYTIPNSTLSSNFDNVLTTQRGGANVRWRWNEKTNLMIGGNYQYVILEGAQKSPIEYKINKYFNSVLPNAMLSHQFSKKSNIRLFYRTSTNAPSVTQLQTVIDNSNPLLLSTGNANLKQEYAHSFTTRYGYTNTDNNRSFYLFLNGNTTQDYIANTSLIAKDSNTVINGVQLAQGTQLTLPENMDGNWSVNSFATYGLPIKKLKSNLNINGGVSYTRTPSKINNLVNLASNYTITTGGVLGSNISEKIDFTISYTANYSIVENSVQANLNNNYLNQLSSIKLNIVPYKNWVIRSDISNTNYTGLSASFNQNFFLWSGGIGYKFLQNNAAELALNTFDILNQNNSISRTVSGNYIEDNKTLVLNRYFMLVFTYNIRAFKGAK
ncbi:MAG: outer membrane beta-barrel protein [Bacteroidota bacterium]